METERTIYEEFAHGGLAYIDAISRLEAIGFEAKDAERMVMEWADALEPMEDRP